MNTSSKGIKIDTGIHLAQKIGVDLWILCQQEFDNVFMFVLYSQVKRRVVVIIQKI
jgi:hypothetical protein